MPTASKLIALLAFAAVGFFTAEIYKTVQSETGNWGWFSSVSALIGGVCGWRIAGPESGRGWRPAINNGLRTAAVIFLIALLAFSVDLMIERAVMNFYRDVFDALLGIFDIILDYGAAFMTPQPVTAFLGGSILAALLTEWTKRRWD